MNLYCKATPVTSSLQHANTRVDSASVITRNRVRRRPVNATAITAFQYRFCRLECRQHPLPRNENDAVRHCWSITGWPIDRHPDLKQARVPEHQPANSRPAPLITSRNPTIVISHLNTNLNLSSGMRVPTRPPTHVPARLATMATPICRRYSA